jgi:two-component system, NtrC family, response regulator AtoC
VPITGQPRVLVVDDDPAMCEFLGNFLTKRGYQPVTATSAEQAVQRYQSDPPAAVILDVVMPGDMDGLDALAAFKKIDHDVPVIVISGEGRTNTVVRAMKLGATDFVSKPFDDVELEVPLSNAVRQYHLTREVASLRDQLQSQSHHAMLVGHSKRMLEIQDLINRVADTDVTVLIRGESGTGKELVARALFSTSLRRDKPFVKVNCAALPSELLESELFGFERGAFTGAMQGKPGKFEFANHGTIFLDEIGDMTVPLQAKLLQVLQDGEFSRLGGKDDVKVDVRVIAATNRDLERMVTEGEFREDLFFRLNVLSINMPPLRERRDEIPALTDYFTKKYSVQYNKACTEVSAETMRLFEVYDWPGNIRELENLIKRSVVLSSEEAIRKEITQRIATAVHLVPPSAEACRPPAPIPAAPAPSSNAAAMAAAAAEAGNNSLKDISRTAAREAEREVISRMLQRTRWNRKETAEILGISYKALLYKIKENGLDKAS